ncbi:MAG: (2Fe-2S)-binding protein [Steroidobacteraceae bacterium]|jgi:bacterioferritin-associated ferredoxin|nr:(2Fe-2S)-binding protein [Steroidobacteraceae bacterium]
MYVCLCHGIRDRDLRDAVTRGCDSFEALQAHTGVSTCCRTCEPTAREVLEEALASRAPAVQAA